MLQKIVFQDNIFQLSRSIDTVNEGLLLDLSYDFFFDKTVDDILFFDSAIQKIFRQIQANDQISGYLLVLKSLFSCQKRYIHLVETILNGKTAMTEEFVPLLSKLKGIQTAHFAANSELAEKIRLNDRNTDFHDIVSHNELSELLRF
jgi:hypothetical protein